MLSLCVLPRGVLMVAYAASVTGGVMTADASAGHNFVDVFGFPKALMQLVGVQEVAAGLLILTGAYVLSVVQ